MVCPFVELQQVSSINRTNNTRVASSEGGVFDGLRDFAMLTKIRLTATVVLSAALAYLVATPVFNLATFTAIIVGGFGTTMAANTLNQVLEREHDQQMKRTEDRPLAKGRMSVSTAVLSAGLLSIVGTICLALINPLAALLGMVALLSLSLIHISEPTRPY